MGLSNHLLSILNFLTAIISIPILGAGIWLATKSSTDCFRFLQWPVIILGLFILLVSVAGLFGSCCRITWLLWVYLVAMVALIMLVFCFTVFALVVTNHGAGDAVSGKGFKEYHLGNYSTWLQSEMNKTSVWSKVESCLADSQVCSKLDDKYTTPTDFSAANLSPIQSGCCKPPTSCGYVFVTATNWTITSTNLTNDSDCTAWSNDASQLCFNCDSCRAGVSQNVIQDWRKVAIVKAVMLVFLIIVYAVACRAMRNVKRDKNNVAYYKNNDGYNA